MKKKEDLVKQRFLNDVSSHTLSVLRDDGINRHLRFKNPTNSSYYFDLITWPGHLCYTGDMGTYVFRRIEDMFEFFRQGELKINPGYWSEKILAEDKNGKVEEYDRDKAERIIWEYLNDNYSDHTCFEELKNEVMQDIIPFVYNDEEIPLRQQLENFTWKGAYIFNEFWEYNFQDYTYHFLWACFAIVWGIQKYDSAKISLT